MLRFLILVFVAALMAVAPTRAAAQQGGADLRIGVGMVLDFAGEVDTDFPGPGNSPDHDLKLTPGLRAHLDYDIHRYVSIGGLVRASWWEGKNYYWNDRNFLMDFMLRVAGHYDWRDFRFYVALTIGPTLSVLNEDDGIGNNFDPAVGVAAGLVPGAEWWFSRRAGLFLEMFGWNGHYVSHEQDISGADVDFSLNQVAWQLGFVFAP